MTKYPLGYHTIFSSRGGSHLPLPTRLKSRSRKRYTEERRKEVAIMRKIGACEVCRKKKVRCTHHALTSAVRTSSKMQPAAMDKHRNVASASIITVDGRNLFNMTSQSSHQTEWDPATLDIPPQPIQSITSTSATHDKNLLSTFGDKQKPSVDSLTDTLRLRRKMLKMVHPSDPIEYSMDNLVLDQMAVENHTKFGFGNHIPSSSACNQAGNLDLVQTLDNAAQLQDVGPTSLDKWMASFEAPAPGATSWCSEDTTFLDEKYSSMNFGLHTDTFQTPHNNAYTPELSFPDPSSVSQDSTLYTTSYLMHNLTQGSSIEDEELEIIAPPQNIFGINFDIT